VGEKKPTWYADEIRKCQSRIGGHFFASVNRMLATAPAPPPEGTGVESDARRVPLGQTLPKRDARDTSVYPSISDMTLRRRERRNGPCVDGSKLARRIFTSQAWSVQPCVRPHMMASPSRADVGNP